MVLVKLNPCVLVPAASHNVAAAPCLYKAAAFGIQGKKHLLQSRLPPVFIAVAVRLQTRSPFFYSPIFADEKFTRISGCIVIITVCVCAGKAQLHQGTV